MDCLENNLQFIVPFTALLSLSMILNCYYCRKKKKRLQKKSLPLHSLPIPKTSSDLAEWVVNEYMDSHS